jgi:hypothetical protein
MSGLQNVLCSELEKKKGSLFFVLHLVLLLAEALLWLCICNTYVIILCEILSGCMIVSVQNWKKAKLVGTGKSSFGVPALGVPMQLHRKNASIH